MEIPEVRNFYKGFLYFWKLQKYSWGLLLFNNDSGVNITYFFLFHNITWAKLITWNKL